MYTLLNDKMLFLSSYEASITEFFFTNLPYLESIPHKATIYTYIFTFTFQLLSHNSYVNYNVLSFLIYKISEHLKVTIVTTAILKYEVSPCKSVEFVLSVYT